MVKRFCSGLLFLKWRACWAGMLFGDPEDLAILVVDDGKNILVGALYNVPKAFMQVCKKSFLANYFIVPDDQSNDMGTP